MGEFHEGPSIQNPTIPTVLREAWGSATINPTIELKALTALTDALAPQDRQKKFQSTMALQLRRLKKTLGGKTQRNGHEETVLAHNLAALETDTKEIRAHTIPNVLVIQPEKYDPLIQNLRSLYRGHRLIIPENTKNGTVIRNEFMNNQEGSFACMLIPDQQGAIRMASLLTEHMMAVSPAGGAVRKYIESNTLRLSKNIGDRSIFDYLR